MTDGAHQQRKVRTAEHHGIDATIVQWLDCGVDQRANGWRIKNILVLEPLLLQMRARGELVLDNLDKARGRAAIHVHAGIQVLDGARVGARADGEVGGEHAHTARAGAVDGGTRARRDYANHGDIEHLLSQAKRRCRRRIAGDDHDLDVVSRKPAPRL